MALRLAVKRLSAVETDPAKSHQHEFHATELRRQLGLPDARVNGPLGVLIVGDDAMAPIVDAATFTLYDARKATPTRSAEWRLYYATDVIAGAAREGDLLIIYRSDDGLHAVIAQSGTRAESELLDALALGDSAVHERFRFLDVPVPSEHGSREIAGQLTLSDATGVRSYVARDHPLYARAVKEGHLPSTAAMADAAADIVRTRGMGIADPDTWLDAVLAAETELYFAIEVAVQQARYNLLARRPLNLAEIMDFAMSVQQSRRSRRGQSLQNHFAALLRNRRIPFTAQCETERGERPDFLVPSCSAYHDTNYSIDRLRMVACKSTAKERWRQVLNEAERIPEKYLLTVDPNLTTPVIAAMAAARIRPFLPRAILVAGYRNHPGRTLLSTVAELLKNLESAAAHA